MQSNNKGKDLLEFNSDETRRSENQTMGRDLFPTIPSKQENYRS